MTLYEPWPSGLRLLRGFAFVIDVIGGLTFTIRLQGGKKGPQNAVPEKYPAMVRGKEPTEIQAIVVAINGGAGIDLPYYSADVLQLKVEKVLSGKDPGLYVRADFPNYSIHTDSTEATIYKQLDHALREG